MADIKIDLSMTLELEEPELLVLGKFLGKFSDNKYKELGLTDDEITGLGDIFNAIHHRYDNLHERIEGDESC